MKLLPSIGDNHFKPAFLPNPQRPLLAVQETEVRVPANADDVDKEHTVVKRDKLEVHHLDKRPEHVVGRERRLVVLVELLLDRATLECGHGGQEDADHNGGKNTLVNRDASEHLGVLILEDDVVLQELEPGCGNGAEDDCRRLVSGIEFIGHSSGRP